MGPAAEDGAKGGSVNGGSVKGNPAKGVVVGHNHQPSRMKNLGEGDSALFDVRGAYVWLTPDGLVIDAATKHVRIQNADVVTVVAERTISPS